VGTDPAPVERLLAFEEIRQLASRYAVAVDRRDLDTLVSLFVPDVRVGREATGREALRAGFAEQLRGIGVSILHVGTHQIDLADADHATGHVYCKGEIQDGDRWIHQAIRYDDTYRRCDGRWLFVRRRHLLFYGVAVAANPLRQPPADWPAHHDGRGTLPWSEPTWQTFWGDDAPTP
jgi:ketosteroid isomerase-like protein